MKQIFLSLIESAIRNIDGGVGRKLRYWYYKRRLGGCGKGVQIDTHVVIQNPSRIFIGDKVWIDHHVLLIAGPLNRERKLFSKENPHYKYEKGELHIGAEVHIAPFVILQAHGGIDIGSRLTIAAGSKVYSSSHHYRSLNDDSDTEKYCFGSMVSPDRQFLIEGPVTVGDEAAVGMNCIVLPGSHIPEGTWIGMGMIVKGEEFQPNTIYQLKQEMTSKPK